jgi:hypothetical protein
VVMAVIRTSTSFASWNTINHYAFYICLIRYADHISNRNIINSFATTISLETFWSVYFIIYLGFFWFSLWPTTSVLITITSYLQNDKVKGHGWTPNTELWSACITRLIYKGHV